LTARKGIHQLVASGYGTPFDKVRLLSVLVSQTRANAKIVLHSRDRSLEKELPRPNLLSGALLAVTDESGPHFLDPGAGVAPFGVLPADLRKRKVLALSAYSKDTDNCFLETPADLPFRSRQNVTINANIGQDGDLKAKVTYTMRGDNELLLRLAFHKQPKEQWKDVAQLLALSDGFRGQITNVSASDPYATKEPFTIAYEISQSKFVDWSKKPVRVPAILPLMGLPELPAKTAPGASSSPIYLGTPLDVEAHVTLHLPAGTTAGAPTGTSVERDYATFSSQYAAKASSVTAARHLHFLLREIPGARAADYNAFVRAVQNDEAQEFVLERAESSPKTNPAAPSKPAPPNPDSSKP
jgi:hypothetical protein